MDLHCFKLLDWSYLICQMLTKFSGSNPNGPSLGWENEKETFCVVLTYSIKWACEIRKFHVTIMQQQLGNVQKSVMHMQSCLPLPLQKLPIVVIQKFFYHGIVASHFSSLLWNKLPCCCPLPSGKNPDRLWEKNDLFGFSQRNAP